MAVLHAKHSNLVFLISLGQHLYTGKATSQFTSEDDVHWSGTYTIVGKSLFLGRNDAALLQFIFFFSLPNWNP